MNDIRDRAKYIIIPPPTLVHLLVNSGRTSSPCPLFFLPTFPFFDEHSYSKQC